MNKNYGKQSSKKDNQPSVTLKEFAEDNNLNYRSLVQSVSSDESISPSLNRKQVNYYHLSELKSWFNSNGHKVSLIK